MKLQLQGQRVRLRIDEAELVRLLAGQPVVNQLLLGTMAGFSQTFALGQDATPTLAVHSSGWQITLPAGAVSAYVGQLPSRHALSFTLDMGADPAVQLDFEVDVRDSLKARGPRRRQETPG